MTYPSMRRPERPVELAAALCETGDSAEGAVLARARADFSVNGSGLSVAILDTGLAAKHPAFAGRVRAQVNFTRDNYGTRDDASDGDGHGTSVAAVLAGSDAYGGVAPGAGLVPIKVLCNTGEGSFDTVELALGWVLNNHAKHAISVVCIALTSSTNELSDEGYRDDGIRARIAALRQRDIPVVVTSGNSYFDLQCEGLAYPAILRECISVGAVYERALEATRSYASGAGSRCARAGQLAPFTQRLSEARSPIRHTDLFAAADPISTPDAGRVLLQSGTGRAAPTVAGVVLLLQEYFRRHSGRLPPVPLIEWCFNASATAVVDRAETNDNVAHCEREFRRLDAPGALRALHARMRGIALANGEPDLVPPTVPPARLEERTI